MSLLLPLSIREGSSPACTSGLPLPHPTPVKGYSHHCMVIVAVAPGLFAPTFLLRLTTHDKPNRTKPNPDFLRRSSAWKQTLSGYVTCDWYVPAHYNSLFIIYRFLFFPLLHFLRTMFSCWNNFPTSVWAKIKLVQLRSRLHYISLPFCITSLAGPYLCNKYNHSLWLKLKLSRQRVQ